jgi:hypothetical protein
MGFDPGERFEVTVLAQPTSVGVMPCPSSLSVGEAFTLVAGPQVQGPGGGDGAPGCTVVGAVAAAPPIFADMLTSCSEDATQLGLACTGTTTAGDIRVSLGVETLIRRGDSVIPDAVLDVAWGMLGDYKCSEKYDVRIERLASLDGGADGP